MLHSTYVDDTATDRARKTDPGAGPVVLIYGFSDVDQSVDLGQEVEWPPHKPDRLYRVDRIVNSIRPGDGPKIENNRTVHLVEIAKEVTYGEEREGQREADDAGGVHGGEASGPQA